MRTRRVGLLAIIATSAAITTGLVSAIGGAGALPAVQRYAGADRFQTAALVSAGTFSPGVPVAFIARGDAYADALAGTPAAATDGGPILLVSPHAIPAATATELTRLKPAK